MATIEPRLIHLLNEPSSHQGHHADLPPLHALPLPTYAERPLPPLGMDGAYRPDRAGASPAYPLRTLMGETDASEVPYGRSKVTYHDASDASDDAYGKKRVRTHYSMEDFVQLPQPVKKQKAAQQAPAMPPIINGLLEPPPHAALFPPISSSSFNEDAGRSRLINDYAYTGEDNGPRSPESDKSSVKGRKRATKPRRKWSEDETRHLLLGVNRHGVGKWTSILEDPDFVFNERTAGDLKDRFRTCCPEELRASGKSSRSASPKSTPQDPKQRARTGIHAENILIEDSPSPRDTSGAAEFEPGRKPRKSRAHRKKLEDLAELGIHGPFKKSHRRERRPFTEQDDHEILEGLEIYGPAWTKIQRDARFHLSSRQPTDLRDRVRNKYPKVYQRIEKGTFHTKKGSGSNNVLEPSVNTSLDSSMKRHKGASPKVDRSGRSAKGDVSAWVAHSAEVVAYAHSHPGYEYSESNPQPFMGGEMDISRLLLDDSRVPQTPARYGAGADYSPESSSPPAYTAETRRDRNATRC